MRFSNNIRIRIENNLFDVIEHGWLARRVGAEMDAKIMEDETSFKIGLLVSSLPMPL